MRKFAWVGLSLALIGCQPAPVSTASEETQPSVRFAIGAAEIIGKDGQRVVRAWRDGQVVEDANASLERPTPRVYFRIPAAPDDARSLNAMANNLVVAYTQGPLSPFGLSSERFNFHVFWDADCWVYPALSMLNTDAARRIPALRIAQADAANQNFLDWRQAGYPVAREKHHSPLRELVARTQDEPLMYPWEANSSGHEASPSDTRHEHHITGDVAWMLDRAILFGDAPRQRAERVIAGCGAFYMYRLNRNPDGTFGLRNVVSPDEWHTVNNDLYTNAVADFAIRRGQPQAWHPNLVIRPRDSRGLITFDDDTYARYQQAAALLAIWPLGDEHATKEAESLYQRYRGKSEPTSPAMSLSIEATIGARLGHVEEAYRTWRASWQNYTDDPAVRFLEKPKGESYFLTGAAGCINAVIYGFLGADVVRHDPGPGAIPLAGGGFMTFNPKLPKAWPRVEFEFSVAGQGDVLVTAESDGYAISIQGKPVYNSRQQPPIRLSR